MTSVEKLKYMRSNTVVDGSLVTKSQIKFVTETTLKKETARLGKGVDQVLALLKGISADIKSTAKATAKMAEIERQITELQKQVTEATKAPKQAVKKPRKLSEMNLFVREQIKSGKSFSEAIQAWKVYRATKATSSGPSEPTKTSTPKP